MKQIRVAEKRIVEEIESANKNDLSYFEIMGTDRVNDSSKSFPKRYLDYRKKWSTNLYQNEYGEFPLHIDIESTNRCNLRCTMCQIDFDNMESGDMDISLYKRIIKECGEQHLPSIKLNFRGEPTINENLANMVGLAKEAGIMEVQFNSNGVALNTELSKSLIDAGLDRIKFSIDGATPEVYESIRGVKYEKVVNNVKAFVRIRNKKNSTRPIVHVQMVYMQDNKDEVIEYVKMWENIVNRIGFSRYRSTERSIVDDRRVETAPTSTVPCSQLWQRLVILYDGQVLMCCGDHGALNPIGNIYENSIGELWNSDLLNRYRELHMTNRSSEISACAVCEVNRTDPITAEKIWDKINKHV